MIDDVVVHQSANIEGVKVLVNQLWGEFHMCMVLAKWSMNKLLQVRRVL